MIPLLRALAAGFLATIASASSENRKRHIFRLPSPIAWAGISPARAISSTRRRVMLRNSAALLGSTNGSFSLISPSCCALPRMIGPDLARPVVPVCRKTCHHCQNRLHWQRKSLLPMEVECFQCPHQSGNIAMMQKEKIIDERGVAQESFLVEIRSLPG